jgi:hypothetical protein
MASYVIFEPPGPPEAERAVLIRDGFHWLAFLVPLFWFLWYRLWIEAGLLFAAMVGLAALERLAAAEGAVPVLSLLLSLGVGFEAPALRMAALRRRGWRECGVVGANGRDEAAIRYLADAGEAPAPSGGHIAPMTPAARAPRRHPGALPVLGLLRYPGGR